MATKISDFPDLPGVRGLSEALELVLLDNDFYDVGVILQHSGIHTVKALVKLDADSCGIVLKRAKALWTLLNALPVTYKRFSEWLLEFTGHPPSASCPPGLPVATSPPGLPVASSPPGLSAASFPPGLPVASFSPGPSAGLLFDGHDARKLVEIASALDAMKSDNLIDPARIWQISCHLLDAYVHVKEALQNIISAYSFLPLDSKDASDIKKAKLGMRNVMVGIVMAMTGPDAMSLTKYLTSAVEVNGVNGANLFSVDPNFRSVLRTAIRHVFIEDLVL